MKKVHRLLSETGFEVKQKFNNYDLTKHQEGDSVLIVEAAKRH